MNFLRKQMKWVMAIIVVAFLLSTFLMYEGRGTRRAPSRNADGTMNDYEVAQINGRSLMRSELEQRLRNYLASNYSTRNLASLDMPAIYQTVLNQAILDSQMAKEVQEKGIAVSDAEADQAMKAYADTYYPTRETFYQVLAQNGITVDAYKQSLARQIATDRLIRDAVGEVVISDDQATEFYDTMKNLIYSKPEGFMIHAASFTTSPDAHGFRTKLLDGENWLEIISSDSFDSKDVINITREPIFLPMTAVRTGVLSVLASLDINRPSPVFSMSSYDYEVAMKTEHVDASVSPYDEVSADIKTLLTQQEERRRLSDYETSLRNKALVVINDESLFARPVVSEDNAPEYDISISEVEEVEEPAETPAPETETKSETPVKTPETAEPETKTEEVKPEESAKVETEVKAEEPAKEESEPEAKQPEAAEKSEEPVKAPETVEPEAKTEEAKPEVTEKAPEAAKVEAEVKTEEPAKEESEPKAKQPEAVEKSEEPAKTSETPEIEKVEVVEVEVTPAETEPEKISESVEVIEVKSEVKPEESSKEDSKPVEATESVEIIEIEVKPEESPVTEKIDEKVPEIAEKVEEIISSDK